MEKEISIKYQVEFLSDLSGSDKDLVKQAREVCANAYAPHSNFKVGASVLLRNGKTIQGSNQENIAYPSGICAERVALFYAGANFPNDEIDTLCVVAVGDLIKDDMNLSPCGSCRQVMVESEMRQHSNYRVLLVNEDDSVMIFNSAKDLLPLTFGT